MTEAEAEAEAALERWHENQAQRNTLVCEAHKAGVSKHRIHVITGIARTTIDRILEVSLSPVTCILCGTERPIEAMIIEMVDGGMVWVCGGIDPVTGEDAITDCETRRGI